ncbi:SEL1-like repeat protein [Pararhizobium sp. A13]|uniref:tetratricopeptide repeat protein n=1 Tax=Pararhizobium sp. A13 TaxID=3133975 RepID=UPI00311ADF0D
MKNWFFFTSLLLTVSLSVASIGHAFAQDTSIAESLKAVKTFEELRNEIQQSKDPQKIKGALAELETLAAAGDAKASIRVGEVYRDGTIVTADPQKAFEAFQRAANAGNATGKIRLGDAFIKGIGVEADPAKGISLIEEAAQTGSGGALQALGDAYSQGGAVAVDGEKALSYYQRAIDAGNTNVLVRVGEVYRDGTIVTADPQKAFEAFQRAANAGNATGKIRLGDAFIKGIGVEADPAKGISLIEEVARTGSGGALQALGDAYSQGGAVAVDGEKALSYYQRAIDAGNTNVLVRVGEVYRDGTIVTADPQKAFEAFQRAANAGNATGKIRLGDAFIKGIGVEADPAKGISLIEEVAQTGSGGALQALGDAYSQGGAVAVDGEKALSYYQRAIDAGNTNVLVRVGEVYRDGTIVTADPQKAFEAFQRAANAGNATGKIRLGDAFIKGIGVSKDAERGIALIKDATTRDSRALISLGDYLSRGDFVQADAKASLDAFLTAGEAGNAGAYLRLAEIYRDGMLVPRNVEKSVEYFRKAAGMGQRSALLSLGESHVYQRYGRKSDRNAGLKLIADAAKLGNEQAVVILANLQISGNGVSKNPAKAVKALLEAADARNARAANTLVAIYRDGRGKDISKNLVKAREYLSRYENLYSPTDLTRERIVLLAASASSIADYRQLSESLSAAPPVIQSSTISRLRASNPNAYVYVVQDRLKQRGLYSGPLNGMLTRSTIQALNKLCQKSPATNRCDRGPLNSAAANLVSVLLN